MSKDVEIIIKACELIDLEFSIIGEGQKVVYISDKYEKTICDKSTLELNIGIYKILVADKNDDTKKVLKLLKLYLEKEIVDDLKITDLDSVLSRSINEEDPDFLERYKVKPNSRWMIIYIQYKKEPGENIKDIFSRTLPKKVDMALHVEKNNSTIILSEIPSKVAYDDMIQYAQGLFLEIETEFGENINVGLSPQIDDLKEIKEAINKAKDTATYGKLLSGKDGVYVYENLGIAKVVAMMGKDIRSKIEKEIIDPSDIDLLDSELLKTIHVLYQNNLNISETARNLYIHRNTMNYRLEKIQKLTGLNLNNFDDAAYLRMILLFKNSYERKVED